MRKTAISGNRRDGEVRHLVCSPFSVTTTTEVAVVAVAGDIDLATIARLHESLDEVARMQPAALLIDLGEVGFCSARGLSVLADAVTDAQAHGTACAVIADQPAITRPAELLGRALPIHADRNKAEGWLLKARLRRGQVHAAEPSEPCERPWRVRRARDLVRAVYRSRPSGRTSC